MVFLGNNIVASYDKNTGGNTPPPLPTHTPLSLYEVWGSYEKWEAVLYPQDPSPLRVAKFKRPRGPKNKRRQPRIEAWLSS